MTSNWQKIQIEINFFLSKRKSKIKETNPTTFRDLSVWKAVENQIKSKRFPPTVKIPLSRGTVVRFSTDQNGRFNTKSGTKH